MFGEHPCVVVTKMDDVPYGTCLEIGHSGLRFSPALPFFSHGGGSDEVFPDRGAVRAVSMQGSWREVGPPKIGRMFGP